MKLPKLNSRSLVSVNLVEYVIDWDRVISRPQKATSDFLRPFWCADLVLSELRIPGSLLRIDLVNVTRKIAVEISPDALHKDFNPFLHKNRAGFLKKLKSDVKKNEWIESVGWQLIELNDKDIKNLSKELFLTKFDVVL